jgi:hypothetical protein
VPDLFPEFVSVILKQLVAVDEVHTRLEFIFRRHKIFGLKSWNIVGLKPDHAVAAFLGLAGAWRQTLPGPSDVPIGAMAGVGLQRELRHFGEELLTQNPMRFIERVLFEIVGVGILNDAADLYVRKRERHSHVLKSTCLDDRLLVDLPIEIGNGTVRPDRASAQMHNVVTSLEKRNLDVSALPALFGENLDPDVVVFVRGESVIVPVDLAVKDDGGRARSERFARHLQFFLRNRLKARSGANCEGRILNSGQKQK